MDKLLESIQAQAYRYGEQVAMLEDRGLVKDRGKVRKAWTDFRQQLVDTPYLGAACNAYSNGFSEED